MVYFNYQKLFDDVSLRLNIIDTINLCKTQRQNFCNDAYWKRKSLYKYDVDLCLLDTEDSYARKYNIVENTFEKGSYAASQVNNPKFWARIAKIVVGMDEAIFLDLFTSQSTHKHPLDLYKNQIHAPHVYRQPGIGPIITDSIRCVEFILMNEPIMKQKYKEYYSRYGRDWYKTNKIILPQWMTDIVLLPNGARFYIVNGMIANKDYDRLIELNNKVHLQIPSHYFTHPFIETQKDKDFVDYIFSHMLSYLSVENIACMILRNRLVGLEAIKTLEYLINKYPELSVEFAKLLNEGPFDAIENKATIEPWLYDYYNLPLPIYYEQ